MDSTIIRNEPTASPPSTRHCWLLVIPCLLWLAASGRTQVGSEQVLDGSGKLTDEERARYKKKLADAIAELDRADPGWRLEDIEKARAKVPDKDNGALIALAAAEQIPLGWPPEELVMVLNRLPENRALPAVVKKAFERELMRFPKILTQVRDLAEKDRGRYPVVDNKDAVEGYFSSRGQQFNALTILLWIDIEVLSDQGDLKEALRRCQTLLNLGRYEGDIPLAFAYRLRTSVVQAASRHIAAVVARGVAPEDALLSTQRLLEAEAQTVLYPGAIRGEWAHQHHLLSLAMRDDEALARYRTLIRVAKSQASDSVLRDYILVSHVQMFPYRERELKIAKLPLHQRGAEHAKLQADMETHYKNFVVRQRPSGLLVERWGRVHEMHLRSTIVALAAERFRQKNGKWPAATSELKDLVADGLIVDPADGKPLRVKRTTDGLLIYSIGDDGKDDGGDYDAKRPFEGDITVRLWDVKHRRLPLLPDEAAPKPQEP